MASSDLGKELECSICLNIYTDPVNLICGHNFCRECITHALDSQKEYEQYSCPDCRKKFWVRPALHRNIALRNVLENFLSKEPYQKSPGICCTQCLHSPVPAVKACLLCEAYLCDNHLRVHSKSPEHVISDTSTSLGNRKCSVHKELLKYFCTEDEVCVCVSCCLIGEHTGHTKESLVEASTKKKVKLRNILQKLTRRREETERRIQTLQEHLRKVEGKAAGDAERASAMFSDLRRQLDDEERRVLNKISEQAERASSSLSLVIGELDMKKNDLTRKMGDIEELCKINDSMTLLQESDTCDLCDTEEGDDKDRMRCGDLLCDGGGLDVTQMSHMFSTFSDMIQEINVCLYVQEAADISLDVNTAHNNLHISDDKKTASVFNTKQSHPQTPERFFNACQVLSSQRFSSGRHYWDVDVGGSDSWRVGVCYPSMERMAWPQSRIGDNNKSWGLFRYKEDGYVIHDGKVIKLPDNISSDRVRISLDYEAGKIFFYSLCDTVTPLHTFNATFTEPLYAGFGVWEGFVKV